MDNPRRYGNIPYGITQLPATRQRWYSCLYLCQLKLVLSLATPKGCKA